jgi:hypothetical protein
MQANFDRADANKDGALDADEIRAIFSRGGGRRRPAEGGEAGAVAGQQPASTEAPKADADKPAEPKQALTADQELISGNWTVSMQMRGFGGGGGGRGAGGERPTFDAELKLSADNKVTGSFKSPRGEGTIVDGKYDSKTKQITFTADTEQADFVFEATVDGPKMAGSININDSFNVEFTGEKSAKATSGTDTTANGSASAETKPLKDLVPGPRWVSSIEASRYKPGRVYVTLDGHRSNDDEPYVFVSEDYGKTWKSIRANLPLSAGTTWVVREDIKNENVLYLGCEFSVWVSIDRGVSWTKFNGNLPTVAVHEFAQHPTSGDIVAATHGRSLWIIDATALRQLSVERIKSDAYLYEPNAVVRWRRKPTQGSPGNRAFRGENPSQAAHIYYTLGKDAQELSLQIMDIKGSVIYNFAEAPRTPGMHHLEWDLRRAAAGSSGRGGRGGFGGGFGGVPSGKYLVALTVDGQTYRQVLSIERDPTAPADAIQSEEFLEEVELEEEENQKVAPSEIVR